MSVFQGNVTQAQRDPQGFANPLFQNSMAMRGDPNETTNLVYIGFARPGADPSLPIWQIKMCDYDINGNVISIMWPNDGTTDNPTNQFRYVWNDRTDYTYS